MPDPFVREIGRVTDLDGIPVTVGVDYDTVTISGCKLTVAVQGEFARLLAAAVWQAGANAAVVIELDPEVPHA
jgi:hypothetical protein